MSVDNPMQKPLDKTPSIADVAAMSNKMKSGLAADKATNEETGLASMPGKQSVQSN